jgi:outer membrane immunogenic protein
MKKLLLAAAALSGLTAAAQAADMSVPAYDWSGFYVGLNAGAGFNNSELENNFDYTGPGFVPRPTSAQINDAIDDFDGNVGSDEAVFTGGAMIGYNYQMESLLLGVEADINYAGFGNDRSRDFSNISQDFIVGDNVSGNSDLSFDANWFGTLRGRLGFAADNLLFYGTAGLAYGHMEASAQLDLVDDGGERVSYDTSTDSTNWGWTAGAGMEYGLDNWSFGLEYLYVDLGSAEWDGDISETVIDQNISTALSDIEGSGNVDYQFSVVRATAKLRF